MSVADVLQSIVELVRSYGPGQAGYVLAVMSLILCLYALTHGAKGYSRHMSSVVEMSEALRLSMKAEKERCEEECRRKDEIIERLKEQKRQLIEQHSAARQVFLEEAAEHRRIMREQQQQLESMRGVAAALSEELDEIRRGTRGGQR